MVHHIVKSCINQKADWCYLHEGSFLPTDDVDHVNWNAEHGRAGEQGTDEMAPPGIVVVKVFQFLEFNNVEDEDALIGEGPFSWLIGGLVVVMMWVVGTYDADERGGDAPAELEPARWVVANHIFETFKIAINSKSPRNGYTLEEDEPEQDQITASVYVEQLEHVHTSLFDQLAIGRLGNSSYSYEFLLCLMAVPQ